MSKPDSKKYYKDEQSIVLIGSKIREIRLSKNMSREALALECEIDYSQINRMELGKVDFGISYLFRVANALEVDAKELMP